MKQRVIYSVWCKEKHNLDGVVIRQKYQMFPDSTNMD